MREEKGERGKEKDQGEKRLEGRGREERREGRGETGKGSEEREEGRGERERHRVAEPFKPIVRLASLHPPLLRPFIPPSL